MLSRFRRKIKKDCKRKTGTIWLNIASIKVLFIPLLYSSCTCLLNAYSNFARPKILNSPKLRCVILGPLEGPRRIAATHVFLQVPPSHQLVDKTMKAITIRFRVGGFQLNIVTHEVHSC